MANLGSLLALLGAEGAGQIPGNVEGNEVIQVNGRRRRQEPLEFKEPVYDVNPDQQIPTVEINQAGGDTSIMPRTKASPQDQARQNPMEGLLPHKGMFGIKGTLRDILGGLGDALLVGNGGEAMYAPKRHQEQLSDARVGYGMGDPDQDLAALQRIAQVDPKVAQEMYEKHQVMEANRQKIEMEGRESQDKRVKNGRDYAARLLNRAKPNELPYVLDLIKKTTGLSPEDLGLGEDMTPEQMARYSSGDMTVNQQVNTELKGETVKQGGQRVQETGRHNRATESIGQQNATSNRIRANKSGSSARPQKDTTLDYFRDIDGRMNNGGQVTAGERAFHKKYSTGGGKKGGLLDTLRDGGPKASKPLTKSFKPGQTVYKGGKAYKVNADGKTATPM